MISLGLLLFYFEGWVEGGLVKVKEYVWGREEESSILLSFLHVFSQFIKLSSMSVVVLDQRNLAIMPNIPSHLNTPFKYHELYQRVIAFKVKHTKPESITCY